MAITELVISVMSETGIVVDATYTANAVWGLLCETKTRPERFRGSHILFIHTGLNLPTFYNIECI